MIALFGGSFDPVHLGHLRIAEDIREYYNFSKIIFIPAYHSPLKEYHFSNPEDRLGMLDLSIKNNPFFETSDFEINKKEKSYTIDTIKYFKEKLGYNPFFIVGSDAFLTLDKWREPINLLENTNFIVVSRDNTDFEKIKEFLLVKFSYNRLYVDNNLNLSETKVYFFKSRQLEISSTEVRNRVKTGKSIKYLVLPEVEEYIYARGLYR
ncbi:nicotinate (nicotinamide) nucleotide adenylyltransferase [Sulfurihydrogenibium sp.]|jgi:nicotinate-nucleotide adenylyltransferase|uniref:nicotinate (nicotinamide) nucleotide adenylyltransferase n=1 Tax=Sulfurihydrogenibium sp. TaxID=2053621 RepID=UPI00261E5DF2|nr:nicotinate (nicotinamide) nucleotide adenylyltransferase [Sulfurihydrogenibium sp.]